jgi:hypothetical protein
MTITTNTQTATLVPMRTTGLLAVAIPFGSAGFAGLLGLPSIRRRKVLMSRQTSVRLLLLLGVVTIGIAFTGCGGSGGAHGGGPVTPPGTSTITVTASTTASGGPIHSTSVALTVAQ